MVKLTFWQAGGVGGGDKPPASPGAPAADALGQLQAMGFAPAAAQAALAAAGGDAEVAALQLLDSGAAAVGAEPTPGGGGVEGAAGVTGGLVRAPCFGTNAWSQTGLWCELSSGSDTAHAG